jgi:hypothetical protein
MEQRNAHRGLAALALAATLGLAGAHPAAADQGFFEKSLRWLAGWWGSEEVTEAREGGLTAIWAGDNVDKSLGIDPNGIPILAPPPLDEEN